MIRLYIVRHAQAAHQESSPPGVHPNPHLSEKGFEQAERLAETLERLQGVDLDLLYSSSMMRALDTARAVHRRLRVPWHVWPALIETGRRDWPDLRDPTAAVSGLTREDLGRVNREDHPLNELYPALSELEAEYPPIRLTQPFDWPDLWWIPMFGELREKAYDRADRVIHSLRERYRGQEVSIACVCHAAFGSVLLTRLTEGKACDYNRFSFHNAAFSRIDLLGDDGYPAVLKSHDYCDHLLPDLL